MPITLDVQNPEVGELVELFELDATILGSQVFRFCSTVLSNQPVLWNSQSYAPVPVEAEGFERSSSGSLPRPKIRVFDAAGLLTAAIIEFGDLLGAKLTRHRTLRKYLDGQAEADPTAMLPPDIFVVERKVSLKRGFVEWELSAAMDQEGKRLPARVVLRDLCTHTYRVYDPATDTFDYTRATCPWTGRGALERPTDPDGPYFDDNGNATGRAGDLCNKQLRTGCSLRFRNDALPFRGFPGVAKVR